MSDKPKDNEAQREPPAETEQGGQNHLASQSLNARPDSRRDEPSPHELGAPDLTDFLAYQVTQKAKRNVLAYFAILGVLISLVLTLFGMERISKLIDESYKGKIEEKEKLASQRIEALQTEFEKRFKELELEALSHSEHFRSRLTVTLREVQVAATATRTTKIDWSADVGPIGDQGPEGTTAGFAASYALQAEIRRALGKLSVFRRGRSMWKQNVTMNGQARITKERVSRALSKPSKQSAHIWRKIGHMEIGKSLMRVCSQRIELRVSRRSRNLRGLTRWWPSC
jgi:hypothetical protein